MPKLEIGQEVVSINFGVGVITEIKDMSGAEFYIIESSQGRSTTMIPTVKEDAFRPLSSPTELEETLDKLSQNSEIRQFDSKKDRINFFKSNIQKQDIDTFVDNIQQLLQITDKGSAESKYLEMLLENLSVEVGAVFNEDINQAKERVNSCLDGKFSF
ncbi:CarD family transcriptional regulator [Halobacteriovorax sp. HFRX-2_2]|uniref:CarD family transcriptional regulator n=1 Tax=unclassified Halobacteriovorax TaxID=2639665 RepID=UPI00371B7633